MGRAVKTHHIVVTLGHVVLVAIAIYWPDAAMATNLGHFAVNQWWVWGEHILKGLLR